MYAVRVHELAIRQSTSVYYTLRKVAASIVVNREYRLYDAVDRMYQDPPSTP